MQTRHINICLLLFISLALLSCKGKKSSMTSPQIDTIPMMVMQIQKCSRLYTAECHIHKIITHEDRKKLKGKFFSHDIDITLPLGERKIAIPMDATVKAYIDFNDFSAANIERKGKKISITLPDPQLQLTSTRIDHQAVKKHVALTRSNFTDAELAQYERQGREAVLKNLPESGIINQARESAASILIPMIEQMGYAESDITIHFRKDFTIHDLTHILDTSTIENGKK